MPERLALTNVGNVHLNHGDADGPDTVCYSDGGMRVGSGIHHHPVVKAVGFLQFVNQITFMIRLVVIQLHIGEIPTHGFKVLLKRNTSINLRFAASKQVEVGTIDD